MMKKLKNKILLWFMQSKIYKYLLLRVIPFIRFSMYYPKLSGRDYWRLWTLMKPGDILLTKDNKKLTTALIGGKYTHAALVVGIGEIIWPGFEVAQMDHTGLDFCMFFDLAKECDEIALIRCQDFDATYIKEVIKKCLSFSGAQYDTEFSLSNIKAFYCSELIYACDFEKRLQVDLSDLAGLGREYLSPTGLYEAKNVKVIYESKQ